MVNILCSKPYLISVTINSCQTLTCGYRDLLYNTLYQSHHTTGLPIKTDDLVELQKLSVTLVYVLVSIVLCHVCVRVVTLLLLCVCIYLLWPMRELHHDVWCDSNISFIHWCKKIASIKQTHLSTLVTTIARTQL